MNQKKIDSSPVRGVSKRAGGALQTPGSYSNGKKFLPNRKSQKQPDKRVPELTEPKKQGGRSSIMMDERTSTVSPLALSSGKDQQLENKKLQVKQLR
jgi:hypothetical protein